MVDRTPAGTALYGHKRMKENLDRLQMLHNDVSGFFVQTRPPLILLVHAVFPQDWSTNYATK